MSQENVETIRSGYESFNRGDYEATFEMLDPAIEWQPADRSPFAGTYRGHEAVSRLLKSWLEAFDNLRWEPEDFFDTGGDRIVVFVRQTSRGRQSGAEVAVHVAHLWTMRNGKAVRWQGFPERAAALEAVGLSEQDAHADS
jgi:ketosteroid isomerase-like protein